MEADGVRGSPGQLMESGPESLARTKPRTKTRTGIFTIAELPFARFDLPIKIVIQNVVNKYCFPGRRNSSSWLTEIACKNYFSTSLRFHYSHLSSNPKVCSILWMLWSTGMTLLGWNLHFISILAQLSCHPLLFSPKKGNEKKSIRYKIWETKQFTLIRIIRFFFALT